MHKEDVISNPDLPSVYEIPMVLHQQELETKIMNKLGLPVRKADFKAWQKFVDSTKNTKNTVEIAIVGKYFGTGNINCVILMRRYLMPLTMRLGQTEFMS